MLRSIVIDDEIHCLQTMDILLKEYCREIHCLEFCESAKTGLESIAKHKPDIVFLDIEMPMMNGFEMLEQLTEITFSIVFTTGYDQYAIKAIRFSALDYLLKPIDPKELVSAVKAIANRKQSPSLEQFDMLVNKIRTRESSFSKIALPTAEGFEIISPNIIIYCEADDNYTHFYLAGKRKITACRTLKEVEELLEPFSNFVRVHHSFLANLNEVLRYVRGEGGHLVMSDGNTVGVSRSRKETLLKNLRM